jgi:tetratricopeptide (TPR) repeat protein
LNEGQNAIEDLDKCLLLFPDYPDALLARGQTLISSGNFAKAYEDIKSYNMLQNDSFIGQLALGDCL